MVKVTEKCIHNAINIFCLEKFDCFMTHLTVIRKLYFVQNSYERTVILSMYEVVKLLQLSKEKLRF